MKPKLILLLLLVWAGPAVLAQESAATLTTQLSAARLPSQSAHTYSFTARAGDFVHLAWRQVSVDVKAALYDRQKQLLATENTPFSGKGEALNRTGETEHLYFYAATGGTYTLVITATLPESTGNYEISLVAQHPATAQEKQQAALQQDINRALAVKDKDKCSTELAANAVPLAQEAVRQAVSFATQQPEWVAEMHFRLATLLLANGARDEALKEYNLALAGYVPQSWGRARVLVGLGRVYNLKRDYDQAEQVLREALSIWEQLGADKGKIADALNDIAVQYYWRGNFDQAREYLTRAISLAEQADAPDALQSAQQFHNAAVAYRQMGDFTQAHASFDKALTLLRRAPNRLTNQLQMAETLNQQAQFYRQLGDYDRTRATYQVLQKLSPCPLPQANALAGLGVVARWQGNYAQAISYYQQALNLHILGPGDTLVLRQNLAKAYFYSGQAQQAADIFASLLPDKPDAQGLVNSPRARALSNYAMVLAQLGRWPEAQQKQDEALETGKDLLQLKHPWMADIAAQSARLASQRGDTRQALSLWEKNAAIREANISNALWVAGALRQKQALLDTIVGEVSDIVALSVADNAAAGLGLESVNRVKARAIDFTVDQRALLRRNASPEVAQMLDKLAALEKELSNTRLSPAPNKALIKKKEAAVQAQEEKIIALSPNLRPAFAPVTVADISRRIPSQAAFVEYTLYRPNRAAPGRYAAYVLEPEATAPRVVDLGAAAEIDSLLLRWRNYVARRPAANRPTNTAGAELFQRLIKPLALPANLRQLIIAPDGELNSLAWDTLPDANGKYLVLQYDTSFVSSGRQLLRLAEQPAQNGGAPVAFANPTFNAPSPSASNHKTSRDASELKGSVWRVGRLSPLPNTEKEAARLQAQFPATVIFKRRTATEAAFKRVGKPSPSIIYLGTHGAYLTGTPTPHTPQARSLVELTEEERPLPAPEVRSLMVWAYARQGGDGQEDGVLTEREVAALDLSQTSLVMLMACDTGLGQSVAGQGVAGLRRGFELTGSGSQIMSLWRINDAATATLTEDFLAHLKQGTGRAEALRQAKLKLLATPDYQHPYFWGAFILSGDWRSLPTP